MTGVDGYGESVRFCGVYFIIHYFIAAVGYGCVTKKFLERCILVYGNVQKSGCFSV